MKKIKLVLILSVLVGALNSCTAIALGAGAVAGGYTCTKTDICKNLTNKKDSNKSAKLESANESGL